MSRWSLTTMEIRALLSRESIVPWMGSPLLNPEPDPDRGPVAKKFPNDPELHEALLRMARPEIMQGVLQFPPDFSGVHWFYGSAGDTRLAGYGRDQDNRHVISWPIMDQELVKAMETSLAVQEPAVVDGFALTLNRGGLEALAGIVDLLQEGILKAALERRPPSEFHFSVRELGECLRRGSQGLDLRWMAQRAACLAPVSFKKDPADLENGLQGLLEQQMLTREKGMYRPVPRFYAACSLLSWGSGLCALNTRRLVLESGKPSAWERQHMAALRGIGSLWLFEFSDITADDFSVKMGDVTAGLLHECLAAGFRTPIKRIAAKTKEIQVTEKQKICPKCGASMSLAAKFCTRCGTAFKKPERDLMVSETRTVPRCPNCQASLSPKAKFCTQCGKALGV